MTAGRMNLHHPSERPPKTVCEWVEVLPNSGSNNLFYKTLYEGLYIYNSDGNPGKYPKCRDIGVRVQYGYGNKGAVERISNNPGQCLSLNAPKDSEGWGEPPVLVSYLTPERSIAKYVPDLNGEITNNCGIYKDPDCKDRNTYRIKEPHKPSECEEADAYESGICEEYREELKIFRQECPHPAAPGCFGYYHMEEPSHLAGVESGPTEKQAENDFSDKFAQCW